MRLRTRHAARAGYEVTRPEETALGERPTSADFETCLLATLGVEPGDDAPGTVTATASAIRERADTLGMERVVLVPDPVAVAGSVDPADAETVVAAVTRALRRAANGIEVERVPAGPYVAVRFETKAHPFADEMRRIQPGCTRPEVEERYVVTATGARLDQGATEVPTEAEQYLTHADAQGAREGDEYAPLDRLVSAGLAVAVGDGDRDGIDWLPAGTVVRETLVAMIAERFAAAGTSPVSTQSAGDRAGVAGTASEPNTGGRALLRAAVADGADLPVRLWDARAPATGPGRSGRTRPTMWTATAPGEPGVEAFEQAVELAVETCDAIGLADVLVCELGPDTPMPDDWPAQLATALDQPVVVERRTDAAADGVVTATIHATAGDRPPVPLGRVRLDAREDTLTEGTWLVTTEPIGSVAASVAALLSARAADATRGTGTALPIPLAPTQVRLLPIEPAHEARCGEIASELQSAGIRADVDDRDLPISARFDDAASVPFVAAVGDREVDGAPLKVRDETGAETESSVETLRQRVTAAVEEWPQPRVRRPSWLSARPAFDAAGEGDSER